MKNIIIVPDIHGRTFWKKLESVNVEDYDVIFLGDMCDVYQFDRIKEDDAVNNFKEIIEFKKQYPNNVTLLLGNHDLEYFAGTTSCRMDFKNKDEIKKLFTDNLSLFEIGCYREINGKKYTFTHSCILKEWVDLVNKRFGDKVNFIECDNIEKLIDRLNNMLHNNIYSISICMDIISRARGGYFNYGSPVWAHWNEIDNYGYEYDGYYQVFGHSQQFSNEMIDEIVKVGYTDKIAEPIITDWFACLDCKQLFIIKDNKIEKFKC